MRLQTRKWIVLATVVALALAVVPAAMATAPGQNGRIAFASNASGTYQIYTVGRHGYDLRQVTHLPGGAVGPDWSPNGRQIVFGLIPPDGGGDIAFIHPDGSHLRVLPRVAESVSDYQPSFTPGGGRIVFASLIPSEYENDLWVERIDGSHRILLYNNPEGVANPNVSPDGQFVTYDSATGEAGWFLGRATIDGQDPTLLLSWLQDVGPHDWAPNGKRIAFTGNWSDTNLAGNIATAESDGTNIRWLTHYQDPQIHATVGSYSPDGHWIVYTVQDHARYALMRMHPDGSHRQTLLPFSRTILWDADWGPLPTP